MSTTSNKALFLFAKWQGVPLKWRGEGPTPVLTEKERKRFEKAGLKK